MHTTRSIRLISRLAVVAVLAVVAASLFAGCSGASSGIPNIAGSYSGSFTTNGQSGSSPMQLQISQSGQTLSGSTTEGPAVSTNTGSISADGSFTITETWSDGSRSYLSGSVAGSGHLSGTWNTGGSALGTWDVHQ